MTDGHVQDHVAERIAAVRTATINDDAAAVHEALVLLRATLAAQSTEEHTVATSGAPAAVAAAGWQRILDRLDALLDRVGTDDHDCTCVVRAVELDLALRRQAKLDAVARRAAALVDPSTAVR